MLVLSKKGLKVADVKDFVQSGIKIHYLFFETTEFKLIERITGMSKAEIRRKQKAGAIWLGNEKVTDLNDKIDKGNVAMTIFVGKEFKGIVI